MNESKKTTAIKSSSIVLIGMPGSGKSTIGVMLAKQLGLGFIDTDILIQRREDRTLQELLGDVGYLGLREIEQQILVDNTFNNMVVSTGGSAVYSEKGMQNLKQVGQVVYLKASTDKLAKRVGNLSHRGVAAPSNMTFKEIAAEREPLYERYADLIIYTDGLNVNETLDLVFKCLSDF